MTSDDVVCICGHPKRNHGDWIGNCFALVPAFGGYSGVTECPCPQFTLDVISEDKPSEKKA